MRYDEPAHMDFSPETLERRPGKRRLPVEMFRDIVPSFDDDALIAGLLKRKSGITVFGLPGSGKTFLILDWLLSITVAREWFGRRVEQGAVVYLAAEGQEGVRKRVDAWRRENGLEGADLPFAMIPTAVDLFDPKVGDIEALRDVLDELRQTLGRIDLVAFDTLNATIGVGDENGPDMGVYAGNVKRLIEPLEASWLVVTHVPINGEAKRPRGHGSLWGTIDTAVFVEGTRDDPARRFTVIKQKDDDPGPPTLFTLKQVEIGTNKHGEAVTSCVVEPSEIDASPMRHGRRLSNKERISIAALERALVRIGCFPPTNIPDSVCNRARVGKVVSLSEWRSEALSTLTTPDTKPDTARRTFDRAKDSLQASNIIGIWEDWAWLA